MAALVTLKRSSILSVEILLDPFNLGTLSIATARLTRILVRSSNDVESSTEGDGIM
jgi:hypothetical protein